jgi:hypothetical protein
VVGVGVVVSVVLPQPATITASAALSSIPGTIVVIAVSGRRISQSSSYALIWSRPSAWSTCTWVMASHLRNVSMARHDKQRPLGCLKAA